MSGIDNAKKAMGWKAPGERASCENCKLVQVVSPKVTPSPHPSLICGKGGFYTRRNAICNDWADPVGVRG